MRKVVIFVVLALVVLFLLKTFFGFIFLTEWILSVALPLILAAFIVGVAVGWRLHKRFGSRRA